MAAAADAAAILGVAGDSTAQAIIRKNRRPALNCEWLLPSSVVSPWGLPLGFSPRTAVQLGGCWQQRTVELAPDQLLGAALVVSILAPICQLAPELLEQLLVSSTALTYPRA